MKTITPYTPLPSECITNGCYYKLHKREQNVVIYSQHYTQDGPVIGYEVFVVRLQEAKTFKSKDGRVIQLEAKEMFPKTST